jgi:hypothetical protein
MPSILPMASQFKNGLHSSLWGIMGPLSHMMTWL